MDSHRRALLRRAVTTAAVVVTVTTPAFIGTASADHPPAEECRGWAPHPNPYIRIDAENNQFDTHCLEAPANRRFRIYLRNHDRDPHSLSIYTADPETDPQARPFFEGKAVRGRGSRSGWPPHDDYLIGAMPPGEYFFRCEKVPAMNGELRVPDEKD